MFMRARFPRPGPPRVVATTTAVALAMGAAGWFVGAQVQSPADAAAGHRAPAASLVTVPVEQRSLTATVIAQGTVSYGTARPLTLSGSVAVADDSEGGSGQLITKAPTAGKTLHEGDVLLEVSGRPVFVFTGPVPMYRKLVKGATGDDVRQLRTALRRLLPARNVAAEGPFNDTVIAAMKAWYQRKGYTATGPSTEARAQLRQLQQAVTDATPSTAGSTDTGTSSGDGDEQSGTAAGHGGQALVDAKADLKAFKQTYGVSVASGEVLFLPKLPTRLDTVTVKAGAAGSGSIGTVADPVLVVNGDVGPEDADLLRKGLPATLVSTGGAKFGATLTGLGDSVAVVPADSTASGAGGEEAAGDQAATDQEDAAITGTPIRLKPKNAKRLAAYAGQSVKITIKVGGTGKAVLTVPVAAVFTSADGHARVSVQTDGTQTHDVPVSTGLSTNGNVQVTPDDKDQLHVGDRVVVGAA